MIPRGIVECCSQPVCEPTYVNLDDMRLPSKTKELEIIWNVLPIEIQKTL
jgi:hypothetical protein